MIYCDRCGCINAYVVSISEEGKRHILCRDCAKKIRQEKIEASLEQVASPSDFSSWKKEDMSEAFWMHLIRYQHHPNKHSLNMMQSAYLWACHDDHGLSNCFSNALDWCGIDFFKERLKELPEN